MCLVDWNAIWKAEILLSRRARLNSGSFRDEIAERDHGIDDVPDTWSALQLQRIAARSDDSVLEIGPGMGRLTIPLARSARAVTVIDPSEGMLARLRERAEAAGVASLCTVAGAWRTPTRARARPPGTSGSSPSTACSPSPPCWAR